MSATRLTNQDVPPKVKDDKLYAVEVEAIRRVINAHADNLDALDAAALTLAAAQALRLAQLPAPQVRPVLYAITGTWNATSTSTVYVLGLTPTTFAPTGWVLGTGLVNVDVAAGTWEAPAPPPVVVPRRDTYTAPADGAQTITLTAATFVYSVAIRGVDATLDTLSYDEGWTLTGSQVQLLAAADVLSGDVVEVVHNGTGIAQPTQPVTPAAPTVPVTDDAADTFTYYPGGFSAVAPAAPTAGTTSGSTFLYTPAQV